VQNRGKEVEDAKKAFAAIKPYLETVAKDSKDTTAALEVGKYYCFVKGQYDRGLPYLARGEHAALKEIAVRDLGEPAKGKARADLAHDWYRLATGEKGLAHRQMLRRALHWYQLALPELEGLTQD